MPPIIILEPKNTTVTEGEDLMLECRIMSDPQPYLQWLKHYKVNGSLLNELGHSYVRVIKVRLCRLANIWVIKLQLC